ncbi:MAG TPA: DUF3592 domain-containing protein [Acidimicrobiia bacterium]|nr:DUF3592 domain-containing protein [Acidimicrobiia bacterium]
MPVTLLAVGVAFLVVATVNTIDVLVWTLHGERAIATVTGTAKVKNELGERTEVVAEFLDDDDQIRSTHLPNNRGFVYFFEEGSTHEVIYLPSSEATAVNEVRWEVMDPQKLGLLIAGWAGALVFSWGALHVWRPNRIRRHGI